MVPAQRARAVALAPLLALLLALLLAVPARAQVQPEVRAELDRAAETRVELGVGATVRVGLYVRAGLSVARDVWRSVDTSSAATRVEYAMRFTLDPFAEQRWGLSVGGGMGYRDQAYLLAVAELEGPRQSGLRPAMQLLLGGGARLGLIVRRAAPGRR
jgi:hypothetical protein